MAGKDPCELIKDAEEHLDEFIKWQIDTDVTNNFRAFAETTGKAQDVFKYAAIFYPRFIMIEGVVVLSDHYHKEDWEHSRENYDLLKIARAVNHVHVEDYLHNDYQGTSLLEKELGRLLAFFWQMAVDHQFPNAGVKVFFDDGVIDIYQESVS